MITCFEKKFSIYSQLIFWFGRKYKPQTNGEYLLNHARSGITLSLLVCLPNGGKVGMMAYNCSAVASAIKSANCIPIFLDITEDLRLDINDLRKKIKSIDCLIVTNLFGINNDIEEIKKICLNIPIIIDNAHGFVLPTLGDFTVYSINQGKYPSLGDGGILYCNSNEFQTQLQRLYHDLSEYSIKQQFKLFFRLLSAAFINSIRSMKMSASYTEDNFPVGVFDIVKPKKMCNGVSRLYYSWLKNNRGKKLRARYMDVLYSEFPDELILKYRLDGIEARTIFKNWQQWAIKYGYDKGLCPTAEFLTSHLVMIPNYYKD